MKKTYLALSLLLITLLLPASTLAFEIGARGYYWFPSLDGNVKVDEASIIGTTIDFEKDLGIDYVGPSSLGTALATSDYCPTDFRSVLLDL